MDKDLSLVMTFKNQDGKDATLTLKQVREDITQAEVSDVMDKIIASGMFTSTGGDFVSKGKAQLVDKNVVEFEV